MKLLIYEPDDKFFDWVHSGIAGLDRASSLDELDTKLRENKYDAAFVDVYGLDGMLAEVVAARARIAASKVPLVLLTGNEARRDMMQVFDGVVFKCDITAPSDLVAAAKVVAGRMEKEDSMRMTERLFRLLSSLRTVTN
jgi:DNA-binding response OmpR family regulator